MSRWHPDARGRLERAALDLFTEKGFDHTTVPEIAACAGLTNRTFFRYFADKREVLFAGEDEMRDVYADLIRNSSPELSAMEAVRYALRAAAEADFEPRRQEIRRWRAVVTGEAALRERGLRKQQLLIDAAAQALLARGVDAQTAALTAGIALLAFQAAVEVWAAEVVAPAPLSACLDASFAQIRAAIADLEIGGGGHEVDAASIA